MISMMESVVEEAAIEWFKALGYQYLFGPDIACDSISPERESYSQVILLDRLQKALGAINPRVPDSAIEEACRKVSRPESPNLIINNRQFHKMVNNGVDVEYRNESGDIIGDKVWLLDFNNPDNNDWLVVNQFTVIEGQNRRPDIVVFINGLPLAVLELKNPADENATIRTAYNQLQTYKTDIPSLFTYNEILVISDGTEAQAGTITSGEEWFLPWRTRDGVNVAPKGTPELEVILNGILLSLKLMPILLKKWPLITNIMRSMLR